MPCSKTSDKASERKGSEAIAIVVFDAFPFFGGLTFLSELASEETPCSAWIDGSVGCK